MKAILKYSSSMYYIDFNDKDFIPTTIEIDTLEDLLTFQEKNKCPLIISKRYGGEFDFVIEVYDDHRE